MFTVVVTAYVAVLVAEIVGDKSIYTIGSLSSRFRVAPVAAGVAVAHAVKIGAAVLIGRSIAALPRGIVAAVSSITFLVTAILLWRKSGGTLDDSERAAGWRRATAISFATIVLSEWFDVGQITVIALTARFGHPLLIWVGATAAMMTKATVAMLFGVGLRNRLPATAVRYVACGVCLVMAVVSATGAT
jgi:Ca2+/H+ antiporter, TMEM165/GDT1 family